MVPQPRGTMAIVLGTMAIVLDASACIDTIDLENHSFVIPQKEIFNLEDIDRKWQTSEGYKDIIGFLEAMNKGVQKKKMTDDYFISEATEKLIAVLDTADGWIDNLPPVEQPQRFGNKAFRDWFKKLQENCEDLLLTALDEKFHPAVKEISIYLVESVGNATRIDYGTGHEMSFVAFLCCLFKIGVFSQKDSTAVVLKLFSRYLQLMRKLQLVYRMEPAGSHGVWSLDDYCFIPFYWGSSQLIDHPKLTPKSIPSAEICQSFAKDYMFLNAVNFIHKVKTGPFAEHSNQLWNISGVRLWSKVNSGLFKMYKAEVLSKYPVIQHFLFGSLITIQPSA
ncbi:Serine/threonine-protein phosphatase 2A activator [Lamellibrachia satsuma]|nr:Serine/threonine-protein phosphatase 2A activator [Lamellibrachia satsuma]